MRIDKKNIFLKSVAAPFLNCVDTIWRLLEGVASRHALAIVLIGLLSLAGSAIVGTLSGVPQPSVHDEFGYLLAADTFAHGRLSNHTHPMWEHFKSLYIIQKPTYMSKFPPAQGLILAAGQVIGKHPIWGVWLSTALMCALICWMLYGWIPPKWAFVGGLLTVIHLGIMTYWSQSYWGGAVAASGGALVFGALRRIVRRQYVRDSLLMGFGLAVLANSRPWEGMIASISPIVVLAFWMFGKNRLPLLKSLKKIILPILIVLILNAIWMGIYNLNVTSSVLRMPYSLYEETRGRESLFLWQENRLLEPEFRDKIITQKFRGLLRVAYRSMSFYFSGILIIPLIMVVIMLPWVLRSRWMRFALITWVIFTPLTYIPTTFPFYPHYIAPFTSITVLFITQGLRCMQLSKYYHKSIGKIIVLTFLSVFIGLKFYPIIEMFDSKYLKKDKGSHFQYSIISNDVRIIKGFEYDWALKRAEIIEKLKNVGGRHLVIVRYGPTHDFHEEWVYNEADIDSATVVWARERNIEQNRNLLKYFRDRSAWLLIVDYDKSLPQLLSYPSIDTNKEN